jgi:hypothetical protein
MILEKFRVIRTCSSSPSECIITISIILLAPQVLIPPFFSYANGCFKHKWGGVKFGLKKPNFFPGPANRPSRVSTFSPETKTTDTEYLSRRDGSIAIHSFIPSLYEFIRTSRHPNNLFT